MLSAVCIFVAVLSVAGRVGASAPPLRASDFRVEDRQEQTLVPPGTSSYSFDYWWPFPPGGVYATTTTSSTTAPTTTSFPLSSATSLTSDPNGISTDISTISSFSSLINVTSSTSTSSTYASLSTSSSATSSVATHSTARRTSSIPWLLPVLIGFGVVSVLLSMWFCYGFIGARRGPRGRASSLEPGPRYVPPSPAIDPDDHFSLPEVEKVALNGRHQTVPGRAPVHPLRQTLSRLQSSRSRLSRAITLRSVQTPTPVRERRGAAEFSWPDITPMIVRNVESERGNVGVQAQPPRALSLFSSRCASPDPLSLVDLDDDDDEVPYDTLRHKSIRRGILERLKVQSTKGSRPTTSSTLRRARPVRSRTDSDPPSYQKTRGGYRPASDETEWVAGSGFRIVEEYLDEIWPDSHNENDARRSRSTHSRSTATNANTFTRYEDDNYTQMPVRKGYSKVSTPRPVRGMSTGSVLSSFDGLPRVDSSILPQSPPRITSPELESQLLFTPSPQKMGNQVYKAGWGKRMHDDDDAVLEDEEGSKTRRRSSPISPAMLADVRVRCRNRVVSGEGERRRRMTPAERFVARHDALTKVEEIVSHSWSARDVRVPE